jgi:hypothetical protein
MSNSKNNAAKALQAAKAKEALEAKKAAGAAAIDTAAKTPTAEELAAEEKAKADKAAEDAKVAADKPAADAKAAAPIFKKGEFVNPFTEGVTYEIFDKALEGKTVENYCKGHLEPHEIAWISTEINHYRKNKK